MGINLRLPNINGLSEKEQISQIRSYLYQLVGELQFAFNEPESSSDNIIVSAQKSGASSNLSNMNANSVFSILKPLIIKSADIVDAYYEEINTKLEGMYVARSDFGTYTEQTTQTIKENSTEISRMFSNIQTIDDELQDVSSELGEQIAAVEQKVNSTLTANAYIKSGLLYHNDEELPVYGVEVGQTNNVDGVDTFKKFARFTANKLSFYDQNESEVAYISDYKLYITSVEILYNLIGGGFILDFSRGFTLKFVGGE